MCHAVLLESVSVSAAAVLYRVMLPQSVSPPSRGDVISRAGVASHTM